MSEKQRKHVSRETGERESGGVGDGESGSYGQYVALVTLDQGGRFVARGETVSLEKATAEVLLGLGMVAASWQEVLDTAGTARSGDRPELTGEPAEDEADA